MRRSTEETASPRPPTAGLLAAGTAAVLAAVALFTGPGTVSPFVAGERDHDGSGLSLAAGGKTVELTDFVTDPGTSVLTGTVSVDGQVAAEDAPLFFLDGRTLNPLPVNDHGTAVLEGTTVRWKSSRRPLNQAFGSDGLQASMSIGLAKITINTSAQPTLHPATVDRTPSAGRGTLWIGRDVTNRHHLDRTPFDDFALERVAY